MMPTITALDSGGFMLTWVSADGQDGNDAGIYARYFNADGSPANLPGHDRLLGGAGRARIR